MVDLVWNIVRSFVNDLGGVAEKISAQIRSPSATQEPTVFSARKASSSASQILSPVEGKYNDDARPPNIVLPPGPSQDSKIIFGHYIDHDLIRFEGVVWKLTSNNHWVQRRLVVTDSLLALCRDEDSRYVLDSIPLLAVESAKSSTASILRGGTTKNQKKLASRIQFQETTAKADTSGSEPSALLASIQHNDDFRLEIRAEGADGRRWEIRTESAERRDALLRGVEDGRRWAIEASASASRRARLTLAQRRLRRLYRSGRVQGLVCACILANFGLNIAQAELVEQDTDTSAMFDRSAALILPVWFGHDLDAESKESPSYHRKGATAHWTQDAIKNAVAR